MKKRIVISKSSKKKMSVGGRIKADSYTEEVVYKEKVNGKMTSVTKHERRQV